MVGKRSNYLRFYRALTGVMAPWVRMYLNFRAKKGKEDRERIGERFGRSSDPRPTGHLVWVHAASVGESISALPLIDRLSQARPNVNLLMTTGTVTSAQIMAERLPKGVTHQFVPVDLPESVEHFLDHWKPQLALWLESELWPNLVAAAGDRNIPMVLVNARLSEKSYRSWRRFPGMARALLSRFDSALAQNEDAASRLSELGAKNVRCAGNLKYAAAPLPASDNAVEELNRMLGDRPRWFAASTHEGEEAVAARVHITVKERMPALVTLIAPRHPERGTELAKLFDKLGLSVARRSAGEPITCSTDIYLADTLGELGVLYRNTTISFMGGSLIPHGGQNPLEPARLDCAILHGPHMFNFQGPVGDLLAAGASKTVANEHELTAAITGLLEDEDLARVRAVAGSRVGASAGQVLDETLNEVILHLPGAAV
jgi:3-deoxy-D-manno-octulosonic-acid transferase